MSWRYRGGPGSGALADLGSHLTDVAEFLLGPVDSVNGADLSTVVPDRPLPMGHVVGHAHVEVSDEREPVENDDWASFSRALRQRRDRRPERVPHRLRPPEHAEVRGLLRARRARLRRQPAGRVRDRDRRPARPTRTASGASSSASTTPTSPAGWRWTPPGSGSVTTTASSTRPAPSSTRSPASTSCRATPPSPTGCTTSQVQEAVVARRRAVQPKHGRRLRAGRHVQLTSYPSTPKEARMLRNTKSRHRRRRRIAPRAHGLQRPGRRPEGARQGRRWRRWREPTPSPWSPTRRPARRSGTGCAPAPSRPPRTSTST